jgi:lipopolysaccharide heptosyltransferase I
VNTAALRSRTFERILLIKPSAFGDVVHTIPVLVKLRARYPRARIDWLITPENAELVRYHSALSNVVFFARRDYGHFGRSWSATRGLVDLLWKLWRTRYDLVIDMHGQMRSAIFTVATGAPVRIGFDRPRFRPDDVTTRRHDGVGEHGWNGAREWSWMVYSHHIPIPTLSAHAVDRYLWLAPLLGLDEGAPDFRVHWPPEADARVEGLLVEQGLSQRPFAIVVPTTIWATKHWHIEGFAQVGQSLLASGLAVVLAGSPKDHARCQAVVAQCPGAHDLSGQTTLSEFAALMSRSTVNVTNDSGSMHLAVALDKPVVSVFGPTDPVRIGPYGRPYAVVRADVACSPCYLKKLSQCPHEHACMNQVTAEMVIDRLHTILKRPPLAA